MRAMLAGDALSRPALFFQLLELLLRSKDRRMLASVGYRAKPSVYMTQPINHVLDHIARNLGCALVKASLPNSAATARAPSPACFIGRPA